MTVDEEFGCFDLDLVCLMLQLGLGDCEVDDSGIG